MLLVTQVMDYPSFHASTHQMQWISLLYPSISMEGYHFILAVLLQEPSYWFPSLYDSNSSYVLVVKIKKGTSDYVIIQLKTLNQLIKSKLHITSNLASPW